LNRFHAFGGFNLAGARAADRTIDFNPNDAGAIWTPEDTFRDSTNNVSIKVIRETPSRFWVLINPSR